VLLLGVTPELATLAWPRGSLIAAADLSMPMIRRVWPACRRPEIGYGAVRADWMELPLGDRTFDIVLGDNCFGAVRRCQAPRVARSARRVLADGGTFLYRGFIRPDPAEPEAAVWDALERGEIGIFPVLKFRLLMALAGPDGEVPVARAWESFRSRCPDPAALARRFGWAEDEVRTIEAYRGQPSVYWFPTAAEVRELLSTGFVEVGCLWPTYEMGDRCPTFEFRARA